jgi:hypothetical protein
MRTRHRKLIGVAVTGMATGAFPGCGTTTASSSSPDVSDGADETWTQNFAAMDAPLGDALGSRDRVVFSCGTLSGAVTANLLCDRLYPDLNWDFEPGDAFITIHANGAPGVIGPDATTSALADAGIAFRIFTGPEIAPMTVTCATLAPLPADIHSTGFFGELGEWEAACNSATDVLPGSSFELVITSVGVLTTDALGTDPLDASPDGFDWSDASREILSNTFHGTLKATLVQAQDAGTPVYVSLTF